VRQSIEKGNCKNAREKKHRGGENAAGWGLQGRGWVTLNFIKFIVFKSCFCMCTLPMLWPMPLDSLFLRAPPMSSLVCLGT